MAKKKSKKRIFKKHTSAEGKSWPYRDKNPKLKKVVRKTQKRKYTHTKLTIIPKRYQSNFLTRLDYRSELYIALSNSYDQIVTDLGGINNISRLEIGLVERYVFLEFVCRKREVELMEKLDYSPEAIQEVTRLTSLVSALAQKLGIIRRKDTAVDLKEYLKEDKTE